MLRLDVNAVDYAIIAAYFIVVLGIGFAARRYVKTSLDYFLSGRSLPAWITGLAFVSANLGALELLGQVANGAQYGIAGVHFYGMAAEEEPPRRADSGWYRSPKVLAFGVLGLTVVASLFFI